MKKLLNLVILLGFVLMIGAAGGADLSGANFLTVLLLELLGMAIMLFGTSALMHYKRYVRRMMKSKRFSHSKKQTCQKVAPRHIICEKELC